MGWLGLALIRSGYSQGGVFVLILIVDVEQEVGLAWAKDLRLSHVIIARGRMSSYANANDD